MALSHLESIRSHRYFAVQVLFVPQGAEFKDAVKVSSFLGEHNKGQEDRVKMVCEIEDAVAAVLAKYDVKEKHISQAEFPGNWNGV